MENEVKPIEVVKPTYEQLESALKNILNIGVGTMGIIQKEMHNLNLEDLKNIPEDKMPLVQNLNNIMIVINNVLHPTLNIYEDVSKSESSAKTVDFLMTLQKAAILEKRVDLCGCNVCEDLKRNIESETQDAPAS